jgi:hypothetical protein
VRQTWRRGGTRQASQDPLGTQRGFGGPAQGLSADASGGEGGGLGAPGELAEEAVHRQDHDHALLGGDEAADEVEVHVGPQLGRRLHAGRGQAVDVGDRVHHQAHREGPRPCLNPHHDDHRGGPVLDRRQPEAEPQVHHRHDGAPDVDDALDVRRGVRHRGGAVPPADLLHPQDVHARTPHPPGGRSGAGCPTRGPG